LAVGFTGAVGRLGPRRRPSRAPASQCSSWTRSRVGNGRPIERCRTCPNAATRASYYRLEQRWPASPFWRRRRQDVALDPRALVRWREDAEPSEAFSAASQDLALRDYKLLRDLSLAPRPAHEVVAEFKRRSGSALCDQRIVLVLQELTERGIVTLQGETRSSLKSTTARIAS
jgi:hypothetical protein